MAETPRGGVPLLTTIVWGVLLLPGLLGAALSPMFFDAPGSTSNPAAYINALIVISFPILCAASIVITWLVKGRRAQLTAASLPLLPVAYAAVALLDGTASVILSGQPLGLHSTIIRP